VSEFCLPNSVPRISLWTTEIVSKFAELDAINEDHIMFGRKPVSILNTFVHFFVLDLWNIFSATMVDNLYIYIILDLLFR